MSIQGNSCRYNSLRSKLHNQFTLQFIFFFTWLDESSMPVNFHQNRLTAFLCHHWIIQPVVVDVVVVVVAAVVDVVVAVVVAAVVVVVVAVVVVAAAVVAAAVAVAAVALLRREPPIP